MESTSTTNQIQQIELYILADERCIFSNIQFVEFLSMSINNAKAKLSQNNIVTLQTEKETNTSEEMELVCFSLH